MNYCSICGNEVILEHWNGEDFLLCKKCITIKKLVKALSKEKMDLLKKCGECILTYFCYRLPDGKCFVKKKYEKCN